MKTNAKKRMLISSVAMLLIAMIALGTATFAWFTTSTNPYADQFSATTSKQSSLLLATKARNDWATHIEYKVSGKTMYPASGNGTNWVMGESKAPLTGVIDNASLKAVLPTPDPSIGTTKISDYVFVNELNLQNNGTAEVTNVKITFTLKNDALNTQTIADYARVALVPIEDPTTTSGEDLVAIGEGNVYSPKVTTYNPIIDTDGNTGDSITTSSTYEVAVTGADEKMAPGAEKYYKLYIWFEGQDKNCVDAKSGQAIPDVKFSITSDLVKEK